MQSVATVLPLSQHRSKSPDGGITYVFNRSVEPHLSSQKHIGAEVNQSRLDWVCGVPSLPLQRGLQEVPEWTRSLRGKRVFMNGIKENSGGMPGPVSRERIAEYWGKEFGNFGNKAFKRLCSFNEIKCSQGKSKTYAVKTKFIKSCTPAIVEYYLILLGGAGWTCMRSTSV